MNGDPPRSVVYASAPRIFRQNLILGFRIHHSPSVVYSDSTLVKS